MLFVYGLCDCRAHGGGRGYVYAPRSRDFSYIPRIASIIALPQSLQQPFAVSLKRYDAKWHWSSVILLYASRTWALDAWQP